MLQFGIKIKSGKEIFGQIPVGNPGGANVPPLKPFPIEKDLQDIFAKAGINLI